MRWYVFLNNFRTLFFDQLISKLGLSGKRINLIKKESIMPKILAIGETNDNLINLKAIINDVFSGAVVITALEGPKGIDLAITHNPDVILLNIIRPGMDGFEVCRLLKLDERVRDIPVVFLTDLNGDRGNRIKALEAGAEGFLYKPIDQTELTAQIMVIVKIKAANEQKRAEKERVEKLVEERTRELVQTQVQLKGIFENLQDAYFQTDLSGRLTIASPSTVKMYGYPSPDELIGQSADNLYFDNNERSVLLSLLRSAGRTEDYVCQGRKSDGSPFWISMNVQFLYGEDGHISGTEGVVRDISERIKVEKALSESEEKYRIMVDLLPDAVIIHEGGQFVFANAAALKTVGADSFEQLTERPLMDYVHPDFRNVSLGRIKEIYSTGQPSRFSEEKFITLNDEIIDVEVIGIPILYMGKPAIQTIIRNITDRKRAEDKLHENVARLELAMNVANMSWWEMDMTTGQVTFERRKAEMLGYPTEKFKYYTDFMALVHPEDQERTMDAMRSHLDGSLEKYEVEYRIKTISGEYKWFYDVGSVTKRDSEGKPHIVSGLVLDISERKHVDEELQKSHDMLEKLAAQVPGVVYKYRLYPDGRSAFPFSSAGMYDIYEVTPEEVREDASPVFTRLHPDDYNDIVETITESARNQTFYHSEFRVILPKQGLRWRMCDAKPELLEDGSTLWYGIITDITERKQGEEALTESVQLFKGLFNASPDAIVLIDPHHETITWPIVDCNEASCQMNGYTREEMIGQSIDLLNGVNGTPENRTTYYNILKRDGIIHREISHLHKDGHIFPIETSSSIINIGGHELVLGIDRDITERKQAEMALKESEDRYRQFISQVSEGVYRFECDHPMDINLPVEEQVDFIYDHMFIAECNDALLKLYGISNQNEMIGKGHLDFHQDRYNPVNREVMRKFVQNGYRIEDEITEENDSVNQSRYFINNSMGIVENNRLVRMWGTQIDITEKMRANKVQQVLYTISNATLSTSNLTELIEIISNELARLLDSTNFFIAFYDESTNMLSTLYEKGDKDNINHWPAEKSLTGYIIKHQKSLLAHEADIQKLCETGEIEIVGIASKIWMGVPLSVNKKVIGAIVVQSYDNPEAFNEKDKLMLEFVSHQICISIERKRVEQELNTALTKAQESDRLKSAFLANMSHEIRTPLNSIIGFSELMADPDFDTGQQTEFAKIIINSGNSLLTIISDIMDFSKIEAGQVIVNKLQFVVQKLISKLLKEYSLAAQDKGIELRIDPLNPKEEIWIRSDENRLRQVLVNLVGNAIKFTKEGYVEIGIKVTGDYIQFHVSDTGIGIPEEFHDEIFERFRQVESSNSRKYGGNGLGLAISKSLVEIMGGEIWIESVQEKGSTFYFTIPIGLTTT